LTFPASNDALVTQSSKKFANDEANVAVCKTFRAERVEDDRANKSRERARDLILSENILNTNNYNRNTMVLILENRTERERERFSVYKSSFACGSDFSADWYAFLIIT
jgi:hypothetical protein